MSHPQPSSEEAPVYCGCPAGTHGCDDSSRQDDEPPKRQLVRGAVACCCGQLSGRVHAGDETIVHYLRHTPRSNHARRVVRPLRKRYHPSDVSVAASVHFVVTISSSSCPPLTTGSDRRRRLCCLLPETCWIPSLLLRLYAALILCLPSLYVFRYDDSLQAERETRFSELRHSGYSVNGFTW